MKFEKKEISTSVINRIAAFLLLFLLSISFFVENSFFMNGDSVELVEGPEKEKDKKEKKLLLGLDLDVGNLSEMTQSELNFCNKFTLQGSYIDILTPPPKYTSVL